MSAETRGRKREAELEHLSVAAYTASLCDGMAEIANLSVLPLLVYFLKMAKAEAENVAERLIEK